MGFPFNLEGPLLIFPTEPFLRGPPEFRLPEPILGPILDARLLCSALLGLLGLAFSETLSVIPSDFDGPLYWEI